MPVRQAIIDLVRIVRILVCTLRHVFFFESELGGPHTHKKLLYELSEIIFLETYKQKLFYCEPDGGNVKILSVFERNIKELHDESLGSCLGVCGARAVQA